MKYGCMFGISFEALDEFFKLKECHIIDICRDSFADIWYFCLNVTGPRPTMNGEPIDFWLIPEYGIRARIDISKYWSK